MRSRRALLAALLAAVIASTLLPAAAPALAGPAEFDERLRLTNLQVGGDEDNWHPDREFRLSWDRVSAPGIQLLAVDYLIRDSSGDIAVPTVRVPGAPPSLNRVTVPAQPDQYTVEVWLESSIGEGPRASATLRFDDTRPAPSRPLAPAQWIRAGADVAVEIEHPAAPYPPAGIRGYAIALDHGSGASPCATPGRCSVEETDLHAGIEDDSIVLGGLIEGADVVRVLTVSGSGISAQSAGSVALHVDGTRPRVVLDGVPSGWSAAPVRITARASDALSGMAAGGPAGAFTTIAVDGGGPVRAAGPEASATIHGDGVHRVTAAARDAAGNFSIERADSPSPAEAFVRIDQVPPRVAFARSQDPADPERIEATVSDPLAGPDSGRGSIAVRPRGSRQQFEPIPTNVSPTRLVGRWDSDSYPPGSYEFRATGFDAAGNSAVSARRADGAALVLSNPVKTPTALAFGFGGRRFTDHLCRRADGRLRCRRRTIVPFGKRPGSRPVAYGRGVPVAGRLSLGRASASAGLPVQLVETFDDGSGASTRTTTVRTNPDGSFFARLAPGPSREIEASFAGTRVLTGATGRRLRLAARAGVRMRASAPTASIGGPPVRFNGLVGQQEASRSPSGRAVELQFRAPGGEWSEFRSLRTDPHGHFTYSYGFSDDDSRGVRFQFRAFCPRQPGWPYEPAASLPVNVTGR